LGGGIMESETVKIPKELYEKVCKTCTKPKEFCVECVKEYIKNFNH